MGFSFTSTNAKDNNKPIEYRCDNCGRHTAVIGNIPQCMGCGKNLCEFCNGQMLVCPEHYSKLSPKDQKKVKRLSGSLESAKSAKTIFTVFPAGMGIVGLVLLTLMVILGDIFYFLFGFLGGFLLFCGVLMFFFFRNADVKQYETTKTQIRNLLLPYNFQQRGRIEIVECPHCGGSVGDGVTICEWCGASLERSTA